MLKNWIRLHRLGQAIISPASITSETNGDSVSDSKTTTPDPFNQPSWLMPAYLRQQRSGDRLSRFR